MRKRVRNSFPKADGTKSRLHQNDDRKRHEMCNGSQYDASTITRGGGERAWFPVAQRATLSKARLCRKVNIMISKLSALLEMLINLKSETSDWKESLRMQRSFRCETVPP